jgi:hypothetical protein
VLLHPNGEPGDGLRLGIDEHSCVGPRIGEPHRHVVTVHPAHDLVGLMPGPHRIHAQIG